MPWFDIIILVLTVNMMMGIVMNIVMVMVVVSVTSRLTEILGQGWRLVSMATMIKMMAALIMMMAIMIIMMATMIMMIATMIMMIATMIMMIATSMKVWDLCAEAGSSPGYQCICLSVYLLHISYVCFANIIESHIYCKLYSLKTFCLSLFSFEKNCSSSVVFYQSSLYIFKNTNQFVLKMNKVKNKVCKEYHLKV